MLRQAVLRLLETYFRHRWLYLVPLVVMTVLAGVYYFTTKPTYIARGVLYVQRASFLSSLTEITQNNASFWVSPSQLTTNEINELLKTSAFVRAIIQKTDLEAEMGRGPEASARLIEETRKKMWIYALGDNQLLVNAAHEDPIIAYQLVDGLMSTYTNWQINIEKTDTEVAQAFFLDLVQIYEEEVRIARENMKVYLQAHPAPIRGDRPPEESLEIARLQDAIDLGAARYSNALNKLEDSQLAIAQVEADVRQTYLVIDAPTVPSEPEISLRELALRIGAFLAVGVLFSVGAIVGGTLLDRSFRFPIDVTQRLELPILAVVPDMTPSKPKWQFKLKFRRRQALLEESEQGEDEIKLPVDPEPEIDPA